MLLATCATASIASATSSSSSSQAGLGGILSGSYSGSYRGRFTIHWTQGRSGALKGPSRSRTRTGRIPSTARSTAAPSRSEPSASVPSTTARSGRREGRCPVTGCPATGEAAAGAPARSAEVDALPHERTPSRTRVGRGSSGPRSGARRRCRTTGSSKPTGRRGRSSKPSRGGTSMHSHQRMAVCLGASRWRPAWSWPRRRDRTPRRAGGRGSAGHPGREPARPRADGGWRPARRLEPWQHVDLDPRDPHLASLGGSLARRRSRPAGTETAVSRCSPCRKEPAALRPGTGGIRTFTEPEGGGHGPRRAPAGAGRLPSRAT